MKAMIDLNVIVDVLQQRKPFFAASAKVCEVIRATHRARKYDIIYVQWT